VEIGRDQRFEAPPGNHRRVHRILIVHQKGQGHRGSGGNRRSSDDMQQSQRIAARPDQANRGIESGQRGGGKVDRTQNCGVVVHRVSRVHAQGLRKRDATAGTARR
jgi:hypothetical protein